MNGEINKTADDQSASVVTKVDDFEEIKIPVPWGHIAGKWWGSKISQPIIAIHGWQDNSGTFDNLAPLLKQKGLSLLCIDLPGHGFSSYLPPGQHYYLWWDGIHYLRRIVKFFSWKDIIILGHSLGGGIAFLYASSFPDEVKKYICIDIASPAVRDPRHMCEVLGGSVDKHLDYENLTIDKMPCYKYDDMVDIVVDAHHGSVSRKGCEIMLRRGMKPAEHKKGHYVFTRDPRLKISALGFLSAEQIMVMSERIKCEVLNIRATFGYPFEHYDSVLDTIEKSAKKVERHVVHGTHHLHLNDAESVASIIHNFIVS